MRYDHTNLTIEGLDPSQPNVPDEDVIGIESNKEVEESAGPVAQIDASKGESPSASSGTGGIIPHPMPQRYVEDAIGRRYPADEFGFRIRKSKRPPGFPPDEWNRMGNTQKKKTLAEHEALGKTNPSNSVLSVESDMTGRQK